MDDGRPAIGVDFIIDASESFETVTNLENGMDRATANIIAEVARIEKATGGMLNLGGATARVTTFGNSTSKELNAVARETARATKEGEALSRQLERQIANFGRSRAEARALAAEQRGNTELAERLRAQEAQLAAMHASAAAAKRNEAAAAAQLAREQAQLAAMVQASHAAQQADIVSLERLRASTNPLHVATQRLNAEIAESTRLYHAGVLPADEYARMQEVLRARLNGVSDAHDIITRSGGRLSGSLTLLSFQANDVATMWMSGASAGQIFATQIGQIIQVVQMAEGGFWGLARAVWAAMAPLAPIIAGIAVVAGAAAVSIKLLQNAANQGGDMKEYAKSLGLTAKEIRKLDDVTVTFGDTTKAVFVVAGRAIWDAIGPAVTKVWDAFKEWFGSVARETKAVVNLLIGTWVTGYEVVRKTWSTLPAVMGDLFFSAVNWSIEAINDLVKAAMNGINWLSAQANKILPKAMQLPELSAPQIEKVNNQFAGAAAKFGETFQAEVKKWMGKDYLGEAGTAISNAVTEEARRIAQARIKADAEAKGYLDPSDTKAKLTDEEKAYLAAIKAAEQYIATQEKEAAAVGKTAKEIRLQEDAIARLAAPTEELKRKIDEVAKSREAAYTSQAAKDFLTNVLKPLQDELALYGLVGAARERAALALEKDAFLTASKDDGATVAMQRWQKYFDLKKTLIEKDDSAKRLAEEFGRVADAADRAGDAIARAFGRGGSTISQLMSEITNFRRQEEQLARDVASKEITAAEAREMSQKNAIAGFGAMAGAAKTFFKEGSAGYEAMAAAEKAFAVIQAVNTIKNLAAGAAKMFAALGPFAFPAIAAMGAVMAGFGVFSGSSNTTQPANTGTGTVFGDPDAKSESLKRAIDQLRDVDTLTLNYSREMAASLKSIENSIGDFAGLLVRNGETINASAGVVEGFKNNALGALFGAIPLIGGLLKGLFGTRTDVIGSGIQGNAQSLGGILGGGFDAQYFSDIQKTKKFLGIVTGRSTSTTYSAADPALESQFTLILRQFNEAIVRAAPALGQSTQAIQNTLNGFIVNLGKIDLKGLTGEQIEEKLNAIFGQAADNMATAAFPLISQFQKVGEGAFETLVRVASTIEQVSSSLDLLGQSAQGMDIAAKLGLVDQFESLSALTSAADAYFQSFYSKEEQTAAKAAQLGKVFQTLGLAMPDTLAAFRQLVEAQNLTTAAGQSTYAILLQLAPAFADLQSSMEGAKSAADIASERQDLQRQLLELRGDTATIRAMELAKLDASNRALQEQVWAVQDAQEAARAAEQLRQAWTSVGDGIRGEIDRIRGLNGVTTGGSFASLMGHFNAANEAARLGDMDAAKSLPSLSQALLNAAAQSAKSQQELMRVQAQTAAMLEATNLIISALSPTGSNSDAAFIAAGSTGQAGTAASANDNATRVLEARLDALTAELIKLREENNSGNASLSSKMERAAAVLENVSADSGGDAIVMVARA